MSRLLGLLLCFCTFSGTIQFASSTYSSTTCVTCRTFLSCRRGSLGPLPCPDAQPCTREQQASCDEAFQPSLVGACSEPGFVPDPTSRNAYYKCWIPVGSKYFIRERINCPPGYVFDQLARSCTQPNAQYNYANFLMQGNRSGIYCDKPGFFAHPEDSRKFYFCDENLRNKVYICPVGTYFNREQRTCLTEVTRNMPDQLTMSSGYTMNASFPQSLGVMTNMHSGYTNTQSPQYSHTMTTPYLTTENGKTYEIISGFERRSEVPTQTGTDVLRTINNLGKTVEKIVDVRTPNPSPQPQLNITNANYLVSQAENALEKIINSASLNQYNNTEGVLLQGGKLNVNFTVPQFAQSRPQGNTVPLEYLAGNNSVYETQIPLHNQAMYNQAMYNQAMYNQSLYNQSVYDQTASYTSMPDISVTHILSNLTDNMPVRAVSFTTEVISQRDRLVFFFDPETSKLFNVNDLFPSNFVSAQNVPKMDAWSSDSPFAQTNTKNLFTIGDQLASGFDKFQVQNNINPNFNGTKIASNSGAGLPVHVNGKPFVCPMEGKFANFSNCRFYYICQKQNNPYPCPGCKQGEFRATYHSCEGGQYFSMWSGTCVPTKPSYCP